MERLRRNLVLALALGVAVYVVLAIFSNFDDLVAALDSFDYALIPAILGLVALSYVGRFFRWMYYLRVLKVSVPDRHQRRDLHVGALHGDLTRQAG